MGERFPEPKLWDNFLILHLSIKKGAIYVGSQYLAGVFQFHKFDSNGNELWVTDLSAEGDAYVSSTYGGKRLTAPAIGMDGVVYVGAELGSRGTLGQGGGIFAIDGESGDFFGVSSKLNLPNLIRFGPPQ